MKKRIVSIMLVMCLLSLVACQNGASDSNVESTNEVQTEQETLLSRDKSVYPDDTVVLTYYRDDFDYNLLVGDNVTMYGTLLEGGMEFKKTNGTITTIPAVMAVMIDLNN